MGMVKDILNGFGKLIGNDSEVTAEESLSDELKLAMKDGFSSQDAALLLSSSKKFDENATSLSKSQANSVILQASDMVIRAGNRFEEWVKKRTVNKKLEGILEKRKGESIQKEGDLPKDDIVTKAESTNGKTPTIPAGELPNIPREKGGQIREKTK